MTVETDIDALVSATTQRKDTAVTSKATLASYVVDSAQVRDATEDAALNTGVISTSASGFTTVASDVATASTGVTSYADLKALALSKAETAVDVFVYDTSLDSDGGAWRYRTTGTSWYNETLNTSTRGSRREFPAVAVIVAIDDGSTHRVHIYDATDPAMPLWMEFNQSVGNSYLNTYTARLPVSSVAMLNGILTLGFSSSLANRTVLVLVNFVTDIAQNIDAVANSAASGFYSLPISGRNDANTRTANETRTIVNRTVNDVAMTVLPDAPIDPATGLPIPTIAVATDGGVSVIRDDGSVVNVLTSNGGIHFVSLHPEYGLLVDGGASYGYFTYWYKEVPNTTGQVWDFKLGQYWGADELRRKGLPGTTGVRHVKHTSDGFATLQYATYNMLTKVKTTPDLGGYGAVSDITSSYNTGWMHGDIKGAWLSDTDDSDLIGGIDLVENGTFNTNVSGWTAGYNAGGDELSWDASGKAKITYTASSTGQYPRYVQAISGLTVGSTYKISWEADTSGGSSAGLIFTNNSTGTGGVTIYSSGVSYATATASTMYVAMSLMNETTIGDYALFDNVSVQIVDEDRSVNNKGLTVNGTIKREPVATGADLVAYRTDTTQKAYFTLPNNYLNNLGTNWSFMYWMRRNGPTLWDFVFYPNSPSAVHGRGIGWVTTTKWMVGAASGQYVSITDSGVASLLSDNTNWHQVCITGTDDAVSVYLDGAFRGSVAGSLDMSFPNETFYWSIGGEVETSSFTEVNGTKKDLALVRISATAPTADQIAKIYEDEKHLFQPNAKCTLYGNDDVVRALAHDPATNLLHVGTLAGRSVFDGLVRVDNTTTAVGTAISASNGLVVEE